MPNLIWSAISHLQLGEIAEHLAKIEFISHDFEVYDTVIDDRGIDFIARNEDGKFFEVQVKAVRKYNYTYIAKSKMKTLSNDRLLCYLHFKDGAMPDIYIIPATVWEQSNDIFQDKEYKDLKSKPEWGINITKRNEKEFLPYLSENFFNN